MAATQKHFLVALDDANGSLVVERLLQFSKQAKVGIVRQRVVVSAQEGRYGYVISLNAPTMTGGRKLRQFAEKIDRAYHYGI